MTGSCSKPDLKALKRGIIIYGSYIYIFIIKGGCPGRQVYPLEGGRVDGHAQVDDGHAGQHHRELAEADGATDALVLLGYQARFVLAPRHSRILVVIPRGAVLGAEANSQLIYDLLIELLSPRLSIFHPTPFSR